MDKKNNLSDKNSNTDTWKVRNNDTMQNADLILFFLAYDIIIFDYIYEPAI